MPYKAVVHDSILQIPAAQWDPCAGAHPFVQHGFFRALEQSGTIGKARGIVPKYLCLYDARQQLVGAAPAALKWNAWGEYGPEIHWLRTGAERGLFSWPKFQVDVPLTPVMGPRLLVRPGQPKAALQARLTDLLTGMLASKPSLHGFSVLRTTPEEALALRSRGFLVSHELRSVWHNDGYSSYPEFLLALKHRKRHFMLRDRTAAQGTGLRFRALHGAEIPADLWRIYHQGYVAMCAKNGGRAWMAEDFFPRLAQALPGSVLLLAAFDGRDFVAGTLCLHDATTLYARNWSAVREVPGLIFEMVCHRPIEWAIEHRLSSVDGGVIGAHKTLRCFSAQATPNAHWFCDETLKAVAAQVIDRQVAHLRSTTLAPGLHRHYRQDSAPTDSGVTGL